MSFLQALQGFSWGGVLFCLFCVGFFGVFLLQLISFRGISEWKNFVELTIAELNSSMHVWEGKEQNRGYIYVSVFISIANQGIWNVIAAHTHMETLGLDKVFFGPKIVFFYYIHIKFPDK